MKTIRFIAFVFGAFALMSPVCRAVTVGGTQASDVAYALELTDPDSSLVDNIYFYNGTFYGSFGYGDQGSVTGGFGTISYEDGVPQVELAPNYFDVVASSYGLLGVYDVTTANTTTQSVYIGFNTAANAPYTESFDTFFAPFFAEHPDLTADESTITAALQDTSITDDDTSDESGVVLYQFRDYVQSLGSETAAPIDNGLITLVHYTNGTEFGSAGATQTVTVTPEPSTWAMLLVGGAALALAWRRRRAGAV